MTQTAPNPQTSKQSQTTSKKPQTTTISQNNDIELPQRLLQIITGAWSAQAVCVAAKLGIADLLKEGEKSSDELAKLTNVNADCLYRVLRALASVGIFFEGENRQFQLNPLAEYLRTDVSDSLRAFTIFCNAPWQWDVWGDMLTTVKFGTNAYERLYGMPFHSYMAEDQERSQIYNDAMTRFTEAGIPMILAGYDFSPIRKLVDVGGGHGILLAKILQENPTMQGVLFEQPFVVDEAKSFLEAQGVAERCEFVGGNCFEFVPTGADAYLLKNSLHGPDLAGIQTILKNCHQGMAEDAKLLILEKVVPEANQASYSKWIDLQMMVGSPGGRDTNSINTCYR